LFRYMLKQFSISEELLASSRLSSTRKLSTGQAMAVVVVGSTFLAQMQLMSSTVQTGNRGGLAR